MTAQAPSDPAQSERALPKSERELQAVIWGSESSGLRQLLLARGTLIDPLILQLLLWSVVGVVLLAGHVSRGGVSTSRLAAVALLAFALALVALRWLWMAKTRKDAAKAIASTVGSADPELSERALRALYLLHRAERDQSVGSRDLARRHFAKIIGRARVSDIQSAAKRHAKRYKLVAWPLAAASGVLLLGAGFGSGRLVLEPVRVLEGYNVLFAKDGRAPFPMRWLERVDGYQEMPVEVSVKLPLYLRKGEGHAVFGDFARVPVGSEVTVRGRPLRPDRHLILTDGTREVDFVEDGGGGRVAHFPLQKDTKLMVAARFGEVRVYEPTGITFQVEVDALPQVMLEGAPQTLELADLERLELRYQAADDYGLRQIDLVLRSGGREDRRTLARLDGQTRSERGGHALSPGDAFLRRAFLPVVVTIQAKDNEPLSASRWGESQAITLIPPAAGTAQVKQLETLLTIRDALTEYLAKQLSSELSEGTRAEPRKREYQVLADLVQRELASASLVPGMQAFIQSQVTRIGRSSEGERRASTEAALLAVDMLARRLAFEDARHVAKQLSEAAKELAGAAQQAQRPEGSQEARARFDGAAMALEQGAQKLKRLLDLGHDLGTLTLSELRRIQRAQSREDYYHAELGARHLAQRLARPNPSFGASGGGVEAGQGAQSTADSETSDADQEFDQWSAELDRLAMEHAREIDQVERAVEQSRDQGDVEAFREEALRRAENIRRLAEDLPEVGADPETAEAALALGREHALAMAKNLERMALENAVRSGRDSLGAIDQAERRSQSGNYLDRLPDPSKVGPAREGLEAELAWAEEALKQVEQMTADRARSELEQHASRESEIAEWARRLGQQGRAAGTGIPEEKLENLARAEELMRQAESKLRQGRGDVAMGLQMDAQRYLEQADPGSTRAPSDGDETGRAGQAREGDVPKAERRRQAEEFRRRVLEGLGQSESGKLAPSVKRYAEGLLQ